MDNAKIPHGEELVELIESFGKTACIMFYQATNHDDTYKVFGLSISHRILLI
jgi:hypothetical protein